MSKGNARRSRQRRCRSCSRCTTRRWLTHRTADAADLVQETYLRAYRTFENFTPGSNCKAWLLTILYSILINHYRQARRRPQMESLDDM